MVIGGDSLVTIAGHELIIVGTPIGTVDNYGSRGWCWGEHRIGMRSRPSRKGNRSDGEVMGRFKDMT